MTNYEKYKQWFDEHIRDFIIGGNKLAVDYRSKEPCLCNDTNCSSCLFHFSASMCSPSVADAWLKSDCEDEFVYADWSHAAVDTRVYVRQSKSEPWVPAHFCKFEDGTVYTFPEGTTSFSTLSSTVVPWKYAKEAD